MKRTTKNHPPRLRAQLTCALAAVALAMMGAMSGCTTGNSRSDGSAAANDTTPPVLLTDAQLARMQRIPIDTIPVHVDQPDAIISGPSVRIVVTGNFPAAWTMVGARGAPPPLDFSKYAMVLIGTAVHPGTWSVGVDGLYAAGNHLYILVHEHTGCALIDVYGRGTLALRIPRTLARHVTFIERPEDTCGGHEAP